MAAVGFAGLFENLDVLSKPIASEAPKCMEDLGFGYGYVVYSTRLNRNYKDATISFESIGDRAQIYINDQFYGNVYVNEQPYEVKFSAKNGDILYVVCENMGRTNFGPKMMRKKGIVGRCLLNGKIHFHWQAYHLPMDNTEKLAFGERARLEGESFYKFVFDVKGKPCDTFLRTDNFKKGFAVLNGFHLGRYWEVGPH